MRYIATADTDIGISKSTNQDSVLIKQAVYDGGDILMAIICDGMGGLAKGELASATVIRAFSKWFEEELQFELDELDFDVIGGKWELLLKDLNKSISAYGNSIGQSLGTTFSGILFINDQYIIVHVGDSRVYRISSEAKVLTTDHTFVAREIRRGNMTPEQAKTDKRRNLLLQCVGASAVVEPEIIKGNAEKGVYMLCSDGFRHEISEKEISDAFNPEKLTDKAQMHFMARLLIDKNKERKEKDNISVLLIKAE